MYEFGAQAKAPDTLVFVFLFFPSGGRGFPRRSGALSEWIALSRLLRVHGRYPLPLLVIVLIVHHSHKSPSVPHESRHASFIRNDGMMWHFSVSFYDHPNVDRGVEGVRSSRTRSTLNPLTPPLVMVDDLKTHYSTKSPSSPLRRIYFYNRWCDVAAIHLPP